MSFNNFSSENFLYAEILVKSDDLKILLEKEKDEKTKVCNEEELEQLEEFYKRKLQSVYRIRNNAIALILRQHVPCKLIKREDKIFFVLEILNRSFECEDLVLKNVVFKDFKDIALDCIDFSVSDVTKEEFLKTIPEEKIKTPQQPKTQKQESKKPQEPKKNNISKEIKKNPTEQEIQEMADDFLDVVTDIEIPQNTKKEVSKETKISNELQNFFNFDDSPEETDVFSIDKNIASTNEKNIEDTIHSLEPQPEIEQPEIILPEENQNDKILDVSDKLIKDISNEPTKEDNKTSVEVSDKDFLLDDLFTELDSDSTLNELFDIDSDNLPEQSAFYAGFEPPKPVEQEISQPQIVTPKHEDFLENFDNIEIINDNENKKIFCPKCNAEIQPGQTFCKKCGADIFDDKKDVNTASSADDDEEFDEESIKSILAEIKAEYEKSKREEAENITAVNKKEEIDFSKAPTSYAADKHLKTVDMVNPMQSDPDKYINELMYDLYRIKVKNPTSISPTNESIIKVWLFPLILPQNGNENNGETAAYIELDGSRGCYASNYGKKMSLKVTADKFSFLFRLNWKEGQFETAFYPGAEINNILEVNKIEVRPDADISVVKLGHPFYKMSIEYKDGGTAELNIHSLPIMDEDNKLVDSLFALDIVSDNERQLMMPRDNSGRVLFVWENKAYILQNQINNNIINCILQEASSNA